MFESGSTTVRVTLRACTMLPSLPERPTALPPAALMKPTICLLIEPASTISTISTVALSVMRRPAANSDLMPSRLSMSPICGPPPCTTTGLIAVCSISTMSRAKLFAVASSPIAWPPYFTTTISSSYCCMCGSASRGCGPGLAAKRSLRGPGVVRAAFSGRGARGERGRAQEQMRRDQRLAHAHQARGGAVRPEALRADARAFEQQE